ncbi:hypothetical protein C8Q76DRAFT_782482 [Earliella scabrosa]|nr:hypothetical protein C8Q76DRAFT_782482 [Earliella scabrosa]
MFPLNDLNIVACALATFSAAVGYNVSRRRNRAQSNARTDGKQSRLGFLRFHRRNSTASGRSSSLAPTEDSECDIDVDVDGTEPPTSICGTPAPVPGHADNESLPDEVVEDGSLKRKRSPTPELAVSDTPASKRRRTPPPEAPDVQESEQCVNAEETTPAEPTPDDCPPQGEQKQEAVTSSEPSSHNPKVEEPAAPAGCDDAVKSQLQAATELALPMPSLAASSPIPEAAPPSASIPKIPAWHNTNTIVAAKPSSAFQAFSNKPSAFANSSLFAAAPKTPIWSTSTSIGITAEIGGVSILSETPALASGADGTANPLAAPTPSSCTQKVATVTGEEDEEATAELKGAKVFVKRGDRDFCEGILGNVKLLKHKATGAERILFRREPVWKVTMSVRLRPTVRCAFDEAQGALRVTLKEPVEETQGEQVVIYALRRGKASRTEFAEFARAVVDSARLQEQQVHA